MWSLKSLAAMAIAAVVSVVLSPSVADAHAKKKKRHHHAHHHHHHHAHHHHAKLVIWKKGKPGKCGIFWYYNKAKKMCHDARWK